MNPHSPPATRVCDLVTPSQVGEARRLAVKEASGLGFSEILQGQVAIAATELATNLVRHARAGRLLLHGHGGELTLLALDRGPGMDAARCLQDGYSTGGTAGTGLGAVRRLAAAFDVYSQPGQGSAVMACFRPDPAEPALALGGLAVPYPGEPVCGDSLAIAPLPGGLAAQVADGLGHGLLAFEASSEASRAFARAADLAPAELLQRLHGALRATRGAAVATARVDLAAETLRYAGVGNIAGSVVTGGQRRQLVSYNGTIGMQTPKFREFTYPFPRGSLLVMHSDGLSSSWDLQRYPGLLLRHPALIAGVLLRDHARGNDDASILAVRQD